MQRMKMKSSFWLGIAAFALSISLVGGNEVQANINALTKLQNPLGDSQMPATPVLKKAKALDHSLLLISQAAGPYDGKWIARLTLIRDTCGTAPLKQAIQDPTVQTSGDNVTVRTSDGAFYPMGKLYSNGIKTTLTVPRRFKYDSATVGSWYILNRNGNSAQAYLETLLPDYNCSTLYQGEATFQAP
jgi:hypothetical protein